MYVGTVCELRFNELAAGWGDVMVVMVREERKQSSSGLHTTRQ